MTRPVLRLRDKGTEALLAKLPYQPDNLGEVRRWADYLKGEASRWQVHKLNALGRAAQGVRFNGQ